MASTLAQVVAGVQDLTLTVSGVRLAPDSLPGLVQIFPAVMVYPSAGAVTLQSAGLATELHVINVDLLVDSADWAKAYVTGTSLLIGLLRKLESDPTLSATVQTYASLSYTFVGPTNLGGVDALLWRIQINGVKIQNTF